MKHLLNNRMKYTYFIVPFILLFILPLIPLITEIKVGLDTCNYLFTTVGVFFSVAMSLIIAFNTREITDIRMKKRLRLKMSRIRNTIIIYFFIALIGFLLLKHAPTIIDFTILKTALSFNVNFSFGYMSFLVWFLIVLIANYIRIHNNYEQLEDAK